jgi:hypothetical protein
MTGTSRGTVPSATIQRHVHKLIRSALGDACRLELVTRNVAVQVVTVNRGVWAVCPLETGDGDIYAMTPQSWVKAALSRCR